MFFRGEVALKNKRIGQGWSAESGFTLIELMIVVAIIAILASVAVASYTDYLKRSKLVEAQNALATYRVAMEQYFQDNRTYLDSSGTTCGAVIPNATLKYFTLTCSATAVTYTATATGNSGTQVVGFAFTIDQVNNRVSKTLPTGWGVSGTTCWIIRKGGSCT